MAAGLLGQLHELGNQDRGQVVDDKVAQILQIAAGLGLAPATHACDNHETEISRLFVLHRLDFQFLVQNLFLIIHPAHRPFKTYS